MIQYKKIFSSFSSFLGILLFSVAILFLGREISAYDPKLIIHEIFATPLPVILGALLFTVINHLLLIGYDILAFRHAQYPFPLKKTALASFVSFVFGNNIGLSGLGSSAVRLRFFEQWKVPENVTLQVIVFCLLSFWVGIFAAAGLTFLIAPISTETLPIPHWINARIIGGTMTVMLIIYITSSLWFKKTIRFGGFSLTPPNTKIALLQTVVAVADWVFAAAVLYILLPQGGTLPEFPLFLSIFMLALIAGFLSNVPGGLGVFETVIITLLASSCPTDQLLKSLIIYRFIFFFLPLLTAVILYAIHELMHIGELLRGIIRFAVSLSADLYPGLLSIAVFILGLLLFFTAPVPNGLFLAFDLSSQPAALLHLLASLGGFSLMTAAFWIRRRALGGVIWTLVMLPISLVFNLSGGMHPETFYYALVVLISSAAALRWFPKISSIHRHPWMPVILTVITAVSGYIWLTKMPSDLTAALPEFSWQIKTSKQESLLIPLVLIFSVISAGIYLIRSKLKVQARPNYTDLPWDQLEEIIRAQGNPYANLIKLRDKQIFMNAEGTAFIMYAVRKKNWIVFGNPVGTPENARSCAREFFEFAARRRAAPVFYEVHRDMLDIYLDFGCSLYKIGEEAVVHLDRFSLAGKKYAKERHILNSLARREVTFEVLPAGTADSELLSQLKTVSDAWLTGKKVREKGFSLGFFDESYVAGCPLALIRREGRVIAFANLLFAHECFSADLMRFIPEENDHLMQYLFLNLMSWGRENGCKTLNLGMAPLSGFYNHAAAPLWNRLLWTIFNHGENLYNFKGLRAFKAQFDPQWESVYIAVPHGSFVPLLLVDISTTISGGIRGLVQK